MPDRQGAEYWNKRAGEARAQARQMRDPSSRHTLLDIAENYEQLAEQAEAIRKCGLATPIEP